MKLDNLLVTFLFENKRLDLPGLGSFVLQQTEGTEPVIIFENNSSLKDTPDLVRFLVSSTGKMKSLAEADLYTHMNQLMQFLNIGRPYYLEGIGTITKTKSGSYIFSEGPPPQEFLFQENSPVSETAARTHMYSGEYSNLLLPKKSGFTISKPLIGIIFLAILILGFWGIYVLLKRMDENKIKQEPTQSTVVDSSSLSKADAVIDTQSIKPSTASDTTISTDSNKGYYRFIVETATKDRALRRLQTLKDYDLDVRLYTKDSTYFEIYFQLKAAASDTARLIDSLASQYTPQGKHAFVRPIIK